MGAYIAAFFAKYNRGRQKNNKKIFRGRTWGRRSRRTEAAARFRLMRALGAVAEIVIEEQADRFAYREGLFVIGQAGDTVRILNGRNQSSAPLSC